MHSRIAICFFSLATFLPLVGCQTLDTALYETSMTAAPAHPVTGEPVFNIISEEAEIAQAQKAWSQWKAEAAKEGIAVDPPGLRLETIRAAFERIVGVAHRDHLPWEAHLLGIPVPNAVALGGGMVVIWDGLFGGIVYEGDEDELAAVLAHEVAHVTLLHVSQRQTWGTLAMLGADDAKNPFYQAAFSTEQEAEADTLAALYLALAGYDPMAAPRIWARAHAERGTTAAALGFLHTHPVDKDRMAATEAAARQVAEYRLAGEQNPQWEEILKDNPLFPRREDDEYEPGKGLVRTLEAGVGAWAQNEKRKAAMEARERAAAQARTQLLAAIQVLRVQELPTADGYMALFSDVYNGTSYGISAVQFEIQYLQAGQVISIDRDCVASVGIPPGKQAQVGCYRRQIPGANQVRVVVREAEFVQ